MWPLSLHTGIFGTKNSTTRENERQQSIGIGILRGFQKGSHCFIKSDTIAFHLHFHTEVRDTEKKKKNTPHFCTLLLSFSFSPRVVCSTFSSSWWNSSHARRSSMARYKIAPSSGRSKRHMKWRYTSKIDSKLQDCPTFSWPGLFPSPPGMESRWFLYRTALLMFQAISLLFAPLLLTFSFLLLLLDYLVFMT